MAKSVSSTLSHAEKKRNNQGTHELELHYSRELDLRQHVWCDKNPGHLDFKSVRSLLYFKNQIPQQFSFRAAALTTKLKVRYVSSGRAKLKDYPLSAYAGKKRLGVGSGCVTGIDVIGDQGSFLCPLENCKHSTEPHQVYGYIIITTAAHVVFDDDEAKETIVEFFDDDPKDKRKVETVHGMKVKTYSVEGDFCEFKCVTHSKSLFERISQFCSQSISFEPDFHFATEKTDRILRLFELITVLHLPPNLDVILRCSEKTFKGLKELLSTWQELHPKGKDIDESHRIELKNFLIVAEYVSEISGLQDSIKSILYQRDAISRDKSIEELCTILDIETTVKRISLIWTLHLLMPKRGISESLLDTEDIYISFFGSLNKEERFYSQVPFRSTETVEKCIDRLKIAREILLFIQVEIDNILMDQPRRKLATKVTRIFSQLEHKILDMITKLFPQSTWNFSRIMHNLNRVSGYLDQVRTLSRKYKHVPASVFQSPEHGVITEKRCCHLTKLWTASSVISNHDLLSTLIGLRLTICGLFMKIDSIEKGIEEDAEKKETDLIEEEVLVKEKIIEGGNNFHYTIWEAIEKRLSSVEECLFHCEKGFIEELKLILNGPEDVFQIETNDTLVIHFSHPHGQSKHVTFGQYFSCNTDTGYYKHIYTVPTCMGCSGGPVWILPKGEDGEILWDQVYGVPHSGCYDRGNKLNHSSSWTFSPPFIEQETTETNTVVRDLGADNKKRK